MADDATTDGETPEGTTPTPDEQSAPKQDTQGAGSKTAVLADLASERDKRQALEVQFTALRDGLAAALGMNQTEATPEELADQLNTAQRDAAQARVELAVFRNAPEGVDAQALLDSRAFADAVKDVDPADATALQTAITGFVDTNPRFRSGPLDPGHRDAAAGGGAPPVGAGSMDDLLRGRR